MKNKINSNTQIFGRKVYTPTALSYEIQNILDLNLGGIWLEAEISSLTIAQSGHLYFNLKDGDAQIKAAMWKSKKVYGGNLASDGLTVLVKGHLSIYAPKGEYQFIVEYLEPQGEGALKIAFEKLKLKLEKENLFNPKRKRTLPYWVEKVVIISSPQGAAINDFIKTSKKLRPGADLTLYPSKMQGFGASLEIANAIKDLNNWANFDLIVITRGGGSLEDLWAFNEENLAYEIASSRIPILAAIGHSTDYTIAEMVADQKAITPTAAAEIVFRDVNILNNHLNEQINNISLNILNKIKIKKLILEKNNGQLKNFHNNILKKIQNLNFKKEKLLKQIYFYFSQQKQLIKEVKNTLKFVSPFYKLSLIKKDINTKNIILINSITKYLQSTENNLKSKLMQLHLVSPLNILEKGYAIIKNSKTNKILKLIGDTKTEQNITIQLKNGKLKAKVTEIIEENNK